MKLTPTAFCSANLTEPQRLMIYRLYAEFKSPKKVSLLTQEQFGILVNPAMIKSICSTLEAMVEVQKLRDEFLMKVKEVPIANKRVRLESLQKTINENEELRESVDTSTADGRGELSMIQRRNNETLCVAREEIEGKPLIMQQFNFSQYSSWSDEELQKRKEKLISKARKMESMVVDV